MPREGEEEQQSGSYAMHLFCESEPCGGASIEHGCKWRKHCELAESGYFIST